MSEIRVAVTDPERQPKLDVADMTGNILLAYLNRGEITPQELLDLIDRVGMRLINLRRRAVEAGAATAGDEAAERAPAAIEALREAAPSVAETTTAAVEAAVAPQATAATEPEAAVAPESAVAAESVPPAAEPGAAAEGVAAAAGTTAEAEAPAEAHAGGETAATAGTMPQEPETRRKRGRPPTRRAEPPAPAGRRGRPRKAVPEAAVEAAPPAGTEAAEAVTADPSAQEARPRAEEPAAPVGRRGRPRKAVPEAAAPAAPAGRRGRPRKAVPEAAVEAAPPAGTEAAEAVTAAPSAQEAQPRARGGRFASKKQDAPAAVSWDETAVASPPRRASGRADEGQADLLRDRAAEAAVAEADAGQDRINEAALAEGDRAEAQGRPWPGIRNPADGPAVPIDQSISPDALVCLEDGKKVTILKRYLQTHFQMTPEQYRKKWGLPEEYPMWSDQYSIRRSNVAKRQGAGGYALRMAGEKAPKPEDRDAGNA